MEVVNITAYYDTATIMAIKSFIVQAQGSVVTKDFSSQLTNGLNRHKAKSLT
jgi:hypothetical protein